MSSPAAARIAARRDSLRGRPGRAGVPVPVICRGRPTVLTASPHDIERYVQYNNTLDVAAVVAPDPNALPTLWAQRSPRRSRFGQPWSTINVLTRGRLLAPASTG
jgi:hypothetical protein